MNNLRTLGLVTAAALVITACQPGQTGSTPTDSSDQPTIAATIFPVYDLAQTVAGDELDVVLILPTGESPHTFEPSPSQAADLAKAEQIFAIGHGIDNWASDLQNTQGQSIPVTTLDQNISLLTAEAHTHEDEENEHEDELGHKDEDGHEEDDTAPDPHYWLSVLNAQLMVDQMVAELSAAYPESADAFARNGAALKTELASLQAESEARLQNLTQASQPVRIATFHNAWSYFEQDLPIEVVTSFEPYPGEEPSIGYLEEFSEQVSRNNVQLIFSEPQLSTNALEPIAADLGLTISQLDPLGGTDQIDSYPALIRYNVEQIVAAATAE